MSSIDWEQEFIQLRREAEELAATGIGKEAGIRAGAAMFARMLIRTGAWAPEDIDVESVLAGISGDIIGCEVGPLVIQYGPCYLHRFTLLGKDDTHIPSERYAVMLGVVETPIVERFDLTPGRQRTPANPRDAGLLAVATSGVTDVARHLRRIVIRKQAWMTFDREWQRTHPDHAVDRDGAIAAAERCIGAWETALRELENEYGTVLAMPEANLSAEEREREADEMRRSNAALSDMLDYVRAQQSPPPSSNTESREPA